MCRQASPFSLRFGPRRSGFRSGTLASSVGPYVLASLVAFYWPGLLMVGTNSLDNRRLSSEQMAPSSLQSSVAV